MKMVLCALIVLLLLLQYEFWFSDGGVKTVWKMQNNIGKQQKINAQLDKRNQILIAEIKDLQSGNGAIEARARNDLGMIKKGEVFYQVIQNKSASEASK
jgi:cell division protein FtsB